MKKSGIAVVVLMLLVGCAFNDMERGLEAMQGRPIQTAFSVLGYPDAKQEYAGDTVYVWTTNRAGALFLPQTSTTYGNVGGTPVYGQTSYNQLVPVTYECTIKIVTDSGGTIKYWEYGGNQGGCQTYSKRLRQFYRSLEE
jgi:hypothetical protein